MLKKSRVIYEGYMDDCRNTDNAWIETQVKHIHDDSGVVSRFALNNCRQDEAVKEVAWCVCHKYLDLYAEHSKLLEMVARLKGAYW